MFIRCSNYVQYICGFLYSIQLKTGKMDAAFSPEITLGSILIEYLPPKDVASIRAVSVSNKSDTDRSKGNWHDYVASHVRVQTCGVCRAICVDRQVEYCGLCENWVCVTHLEACHVCPGIFCCACRLNFGGCH